MAAAPRTRPSGQRSRKAAPPLRPEPAAPGRGAALLRRLGGSALLFPLLAIGLVLLATADDRHVGLVADERQVIRTAVALSETLQIAQAEGRDFTFVAPDGRSVSRFGIGMSLLEVPSAILAPVVESRLGAGSSQPLFLLPSLLLVLAAAAFAGTAARHLGASVPAQRIAAVLAGIGSPLGSYGATAFSEPLQAAAITGAFASSLAALHTGTARQGLIRAALAGALASAAVLAKSSMLAVAPLALLPLLAGTDPRGRAGRLAWAAAGAVPGLSLWAWFEFVRFGTLLGSYPGESFSHPLADGVWRLTVGPNLGLLWFFPAFAAAIWAAGRTVMTRQWTAALTGLPPVLATISIVTTAAGWWAWHGVWGWGPRLIVPVVPLLAAAAASVIAAWPMPARVLLVAGSILLNAPGLIQHPVPVATYATKLAWPAATPSEAAQVAAYARRQDADGQWRISPDHVLATVPQASPFAVFPWFFRSTCCGGAGTASALDSPPWRDVRPDLLPAERPMSAALRDAIAGPPRARFWGRGFVPSPADARYAAVYDDALLDQVIRLQQQRETAAALRLAQKLVRLAPTGTHDGFVLECYRIGGDRIAARAYLDGLTRERRMAPAINVALALFERDAGNEPFARQLLGSVAEFFGADAPLRHAPDLPLAAWPPDLASMLARPVLAAGQ